MEDDMPGIIWSIRERLRKKAAQYNDEELKEIAREVDEKLVPIEDMDKILKICKKRKK